MISTIAILLTDITKRAGTERAVVNLANILVSLKHNVFIFSIGRRHIISTKRFK